MNKLVREQLNKVYQADLSNFDESTNTFYIKKKTSVKLETDQCYIIKIDRSLLNNSVLFDNWNKGIYPKSLYLKADISRIMNNMIKVNCIELDDTTLEDTPGIWSGWLPTENIEVLQKL